MRRLILIASAVLVLLEIPIAAAQTDKKIPLAKESEKKSTLLCTHGCGSSDEKRYDVDSKTYKGEIIRGPRTVVAYNLNPLRYSYKWQSAVTYTAPPDLWSKLTGLGAPQSAPTQPTPPSTKEPKPPSALAGHAMRARVQQEGARAFVKGNQIPMSQETVDLVAKADKALLAAQQSVKSANDQIVGLDQPLKDLRVDFDDVTSQVAKANISLANVAIAGQELIAFLGRIDAGSTYDGIKNELSDSAEFNFMKGVTSQWPDLTTVARLQNSTDTRKSLLSATKTAFDAAHPSLLAALTVSQRDLEAAYDNLDSQALKLMGVPQRSVELDYVNKTIEDLKTRLGEVTQAKTDLESASVTLNGAISENTSMVSALSNLDTNSDKYKSFQAAQGTLVQWKHNMMQVKQEWDSYQGDKDHKENPFVTSFSAGCDYTFASTKQNAITLTQVDNLPDKTATPPTDVLSLTMSCASPFTVSAGVEFSTVPNKEFGIQPVATPPGSTTTTNEFVLTANSSFHPLPIAMVSARFCEPNENLSFHVSLGIAGNFNSQNAGGSSAEFLIGPSIALFRTMFFTPGLAIGKKSSLGDGFVVGNPVPPNITTPPLQTSYTTGFGFSITFTKP